MRSPQALWPVLCASASLLCASSAGAYCRTTTADQIAGCPAPCQTEGKPLSWHTAHLNYAFNVRPFPNFTDQGLHDVMAESFGAWEAVMCDESASDPSLGQVSVGLDIEAKPYTTTLEVSPPGKGKVDENTIVWFSGPDWVNDGYDPNAFALTSVWFDTNTGEILGADMHFNGAMNFTQCPASGCPTYQDRVDLRNVATHEAGHFLGLSHSDVTDSTMWCDARPGDVDKRTLAPDDIAGLCAIYPPGQSFPNDQVQRASTGCRAAPTVAGGAWGGLAGLLLGGVTWFRRRRR